MSVIPLKTGKKSCGEKSSPLHTDYSDCEFEMVQGQGKEGSSLNTCQASGPTLITVRRKRSEFVTLEEPQNNLFKTLTKSKLTETIQDGSCGQVGSSGQSLEKEQRRKFHVISKTISQQHCKYCDYSSKYTSNVRRHERTHTGEEPYECTWCDYAAKSSSAMRIHVRTHTGEKPYKCESCSYCATHIANLQLHERTHTGAKAYQCQHCDYSSTQDSNLRRHERTHTGDKPYKCQHCDYRSTTTSNLRRHARIHAGEKPYKCTHCNYRGNQVWHLRRHEQSHTRGNLKKM